MNRRIGWLRLGALTALAALLLTGTALAQSSADVYRLPAGEVFDGDLYIGASEVIIDGTVQGDLITSAGRIVINGTVEEDLMAVAGEIVITGAVLDDVRVAGARVEISGQIGDDLYAAAGGGPGGQFPLTVNGRTIQQGLYVQPTATIGGNAGLFGGTVVAAGAIDGDLTIGAADVQLRGAVGGNATIDGNTVMIADTARVGGTLAYTAPAEVNVPANVAERVEFSPTPPRQTQATPGPNPVLMNMLRALLTLAGFAALGWLLLRFAPGRITKPVAALRARPAYAILYGFIAALVLIFFPIASALLVFAMVLFWGWWPGLALLAFLFATLTLVWVLSPIITGYWIGQLVAQATGRTFSPIVVLLIGVALIVLVSFVPIVGWMIYLASFVLALGAMFVAWRGGYDAPEARYTPVMTPA
jgi:cytoskeletal protein CcmA (bactofilin family)